MVITKRLPDGTAYHMRGEGPVCILLHGFGEDGHIWDQQVDELSDQFTCLMIEIPGTGDSTAAFAQHKDLNLEESAELVRQVMDKEKINKACLLGHSMGGYITLAFAEKYSQRLSAFGLVHSTAFADSEEKSQNRRRSVTFMKNHGVKLFLEQLYPNLYGEKYKKEYWDHIEKQIRDAEVFQPEVLIRYYEMMMVRPNRTAVLQHAAVPVLFIMGNEDKTVLLTDSLRQCHLPSESHIHILETAGHMGMKEEPMRTTQAMKDFLLYVTEN